MEELWEGFETAKRLPCVGLLGLLYAASSARGMWELSIIYILANTTRRFADRNAKGDSGEVEGSEEGWGKGRQCEVRGSEGRCAAEH